MRARRLMTVAAVLAAVLVAAGCGGGTSSNNNSAGGGGTVKQGGIFTLGSTNYIDTLNVFNYIEAGATVSFLEIYPELVQYGPGLKEIVPSFAESWTVSPDGKTYTFKLHSGAKWSDGQPLTSEDVAWTANTIIKYPGPTAVLASSVRSEEHTSALQS